jgi:hypothetical protein
MPESAEEIYARVVAEVGEHGHLPMPAAGEWDVFPWAVVDGQIAPRVVPPPAAERPRNGDPDHRLCGTCTDRENGRVIWENERWTVTRMPAPTGLPLVLFLQTKEHLDYPDMDDDLASEYGRLSVWLCRIMSNLPHIGRVHVNRWGDGGGHLHVWFLARPARMTGILGSYAVEWDAILPPGPEEVWRADLHTVATKLAFHDGHARV